MRGLTDREMLLLLSWYLEERSPVVDGWVLDGGGAIGVRVYIGAGCLYGCDRAFPVRLMLQQEKAS